jgi:hypothetical protein
VPVVVELDSNQESVFNPIRNQILPFCESKPEINDLSINYGIDSVYESPLYTLDPSPMKEALMTPF